MSEKPADDIKNMKQKNCGIEMSPTITSSVIHNEFAIDETVEKKNASPPYPEPGFPNINMGSKTGFANHGDYKRDMEMSVISTSTQIFSTSQVETYHTQDDNTESKVDCDQIKCNSHTIIETKTIRSRYDEDKIDLQNVDIRNHYDDDNNNVPNMSSPHIHKKRICKLNSVPEEEGPPFMNKALSPMCARKGANDEVKRVDNDGTTCLGCKSNENELQKLRRELDIIKETIKEFTIDGRTVKHSKPSEMSNVIENPYAVEQMDYSQGSTYNSILDHRQGSAQPPSDCNRMLINIGGVCHETYRSTLRNIPETRLTWLATNTNVSECNSGNEELFFDRHPQMFSHILNYYRTGKLHIPYDVCGPLFEEELQYWGIDDSQVESCCWLTYRQHRDAQETLKEFEGTEFQRDFEDDSDVDLTACGFEYNQKGSRKDYTWYQRWQPYIWKMTENPTSSKKAKVLAYFSMLLILLSVVTFCLETVSYFRTNDSRKLVLTVSEGVCVFFFTLEITVRFTFCVNRKAFFKDAMNWIDLFAIVPFFVTIIMKYGIANTEDHLTILQSIRIIRVFRIIKLSKHSVGLQILGHTLKASIRELILLIFFLIIGIVIFSSLVYYSEFKECGTKFTDIPTTFWWAVITMTTVGYGDMVPETTWGKIFGALCSISGVLMIAMPVPVIVNNFNLYYSHAQARQKLPKKKRHMLCGAASLLRRSGAVKRKAQVSEIEDGNENTMSFCGYEGEGTPNSQMSRIVHRSERTNKSMRRDSNTFAIHSSSNVDLSSYSITEEGERTRNEKRETIDQSAMAIHRSESVKGFSRSDSNTFETQSFNNAEVVSNPNAEDECPASADQTNTMIHRSKRMKKFSRRNSNTFATQSMASNDVQRHEQYKKRSFGLSPLPTIDSMPEVEPQDKLDTVS